MNDTVEVRLRYAVTGSLDQAKKDLHDRFLYNHEDRTEIAEISRMADRSNLHRAFTAKRVAVDINPEEVYNYRNGETSTVALFLENNRRPYDQLKMLVRVALPQHNSPDNDPNAHTSAVVWLADEIEKLVEQLYLQIDNREESCRTDADRLAYDLLTAALGRVDWRELARCYLDSAKEG